MGAMAGRAPFWRSQNAAGRFAAGRRAARGPYIPGVFTSEFGLLHEFVRRPGRVLSRDFLLDAAVGRRNVPFDRSVDVMVGRLRRKVEPEAKQPTVIQTVAGEGYRFSAPLYPPKPAPAPSASADGIVGAVVDRAPGQRPRLQRRPAHRRRPRRPGASDGSRRPRHFASLR